jgi:heme/copper-type cytochrome/quinol oxidase subunit 2
MYIYGSEGEYGFIDHNPIPMTWPVPHFEKLLLDKNSSRRRIFNCRMMDALIISYKYRRSMDTNLEMYNYRCLSVDKELWLPVWTSIRILITATDVLHS